MNIFDSGMLTAAAALIAMGREIGWTTITDAPESFSWKIKSSTVPNGLAGETTPPIYIKSEEKEI